MIIGNKRKNIQKLEKNLKVKIDIHNDGEVVVTGKVRKCVEAKLAIEHMISLKIREIYKEHFFVRKN